LGDCVKMLNAIFPWIHIVKGRPRHPQSQGSLELFHAPYKRALAQAMTNANTDNWLAHMCTFQCAINNHPVCSHKNLSPYPMYYARPNKSCYSSIFGRAYKEYRTEFGLRVAKLALKRLKIGDPS